MDTWATSSLTPQIAGRWADDPDGFARIFPMDLRPQGHDIIRTWLFSTMVRSHFEFDRAPWANAALSGWILDPDRKKMSKSKGNVVTPVELFATYGSDAVRYWAVSARPGVDTAFSEDQMKVGRKLATKLLNATKFVLGLGAAAGDTVRDPLDAAMLASLAAVVDEATAAFDDYDYARALERTEAWFWWFCDDYLELVKGRAYDDAHPGAASARAALRRALGCVHRLLAPLLPFVTEEVWGWWREGSVHRAAWPTRDEVLAGVPSDSDAAALLAATCEVLAAIRRTKTERKVSQRAEVARCEVRGPALRIALLAGHDGDLRNAGGVRELVYDGVATPEVPATLETTVTLA
jgi:valyl-tRNA synthetase